MMIALHKNARTTPAIRAEIAASSDTASVLAKRYGITEQTAYKWKKRTSVADRSHTAHHLQTQLTSAQETVVVHLRRTLLLPLDDLLAVTKEFICPSVSRSGLDRCLRRHGVGNLNALKPKTPSEPHRVFKLYEPGYLHMDVKYLPQMQNEARRRYLFVAIDRATRWVFVAIKDNKTAASAKAFLRALQKACPIKIQKLLTDNGKEFTDRLFANRERAPSGNHEFDQLCQQFGIEHRLTRPRTPKTNGMVERFNGRIADVLKTHRFSGSEDLEQTLLRYVALYNHQLPQSALKSKTPMQAMKEWHQSHPHLFNKRPYDRPGCDSYLSRATFRITTQPAPSGLFYDYAMTKLTDNRPQSIKFRAHKAEVLKAITSAVGGITAVAVVAMFPEVGPDTTRKAITRLRGEKLVYIDKWLYTPHGSPPMRLKAGNKPDAPRLVKPPRQKLGPRVSIAAVDRKVLLAVKNSADTAKKVAEKTGLELWRAKESLCRLREKGAVMYDRGLGINRWRLAGHPEHFRTPSIRPLVAMRTTFAGGFNPWQGL